MKREKVFGRNVLTFENRPKTIPLMLEETVKNFPEREAIIVGEKRVTYAKLAKNVKQLAVHFQQKYQLKKGDRIAILMENRLEFVQTLLACSTLGIIAVPLNARCTEDELDYMINHADVQIICAEKGYESLLQKWQNNQPERIVILTEESADFNGQYELFESIFNMTKDISALELPDLSEEDPLYILFTSGTTGLPKGAIGSHVNAIHSVINYREVMQMEEPVRTLIAIPLFHVTGLIGQLLYMLLIGGTSVIMYRYRTEEFINLIEKEKVTFLFNVPTIYIMAMNHEKFHQTNFSSLKVVAYGGAPMSQDTISRLKESIPGISLRNAYGATETTSPASIMPKQTNNFSKVGSVGKPVPVAEMKIVDNDNKILPAGEVGELFIKGPMIIEGYWRDKEANASNFSDSYWKSGDIAMLDEDDYLYIMDRKKEMINHGGEKVFSVEVENVIYEHSDVLEVAVIGVPDPLFGEAVIAYIVPKEDIIPRISDIQSFLKERLAKFKIPERIEIIESMPRNAGGKILKAKLAARNK